MVDKLRLVLSELEAQRGSVSLFAMFKMDDVVDKWTILVGAPWVTNANGQEIFTILKSSITHNCSDEERSTIARIGIYNNNHHLIQELSHFKSNTLIKEKTQVNGNTIYEGEIIKSIDVAVT